ERFYYPDRARPPLWPRVRIPDRARAASNPFGSRTLPDHHLGVVALRILSDVDARRQRLSCRVRGRVGHGQYGVEGRPGVSALPARSYLARTNHDVSDAWPVGNAIGVPG